MAGNNAIGSAAVLLTANADQLVSGLTTAERKVGGWARSVEAKFAAVGAGPAAGGVFNKLSRLADRFGANGLVGRAIFGTQQRDEGGAVVGRVGGLFGRLRRIANQFGTNGVFGRAILGTAEFDAESGKFLGRVGGLFGRARDTAEKAGKGGLLKSLLGGAVAGIAAGLAFAGSEKALGFIANLPDHVERLKGTVEGTDWGQLDALGDSFATIQGAADALLTKFLTALAPAVGVIADAIGTTFGDHADLINAWGDRLSVAATVAAELFGVVLDEGARVLEMLGTWASETIGLGETTGTVTERMFAALRTVAKGFGYVWDSVKAGAGAIAYVAGVIVEGFGEVLKVIGSAIAKLDELARELPEAIRPDWIGQAADAVKGWGGSIDQAGEKMQRWGKGAVMAWGDSARAADAWFDGVEQRFNQRRADAAGRVRPVGEVKLAAALERGSVGAASVVAKFNAKGLTEGSDKQLNAQKEANRLLRELNKKMDKLQGGVI